MNIIDSKIYWWRLGGGGGESQEIFHIEPISKVFGIQ
jgi:hypothetical protein